MSSYSISHIIRQNPWAKAANELTIVEDLQTIHSPYGHSADDVELYNTTGDALALHNNATRFIKEVAVGEFALIPQSKSKTGDPLLLVKIATEPIAGPIEGLVVICKERKCTHRYIQSDCALCKASVDRVVQLKDLSEREKLELMMNRGKIQHIEPFIALSRKVTIMGHVTAPAKGDVVRPWFENWKSPSSIFKPKNITIPRSDVIKTPAQKKRDGDDIADFFSA